jgi:aldehyde:ferredoxin oxidoreductase
VEIYEDPGFSKDSHLLGEELTEVFAEEEKDYKNIGIVSSGAAAEHSLIGMINFTFYDPKRKK